MLDERRLRIAPERSVPVMTALLAEWPMVVYKPTPDGLLFTGPFAITALQSGAELRLEGVQLNAWCELAKSLKRKGGFPDTQTESRLVQRITPLFSTIAFQ